MAKRANSLAKQLAELGNAAPAEYELESDPEALDAGRPGDDASDDGSDGEEEARSHARHNVVQVAPSKMRKHASHMESNDDGTLTRYKGVRTTRREMMDDDSDEDDDEEIISEDESEQDESGVSEEEGMGGLSEDDADQIGDGDSESEEGGGGGGQEEEEESEIEDGGKVQKSLRFANSRQSGQANAAEADAALLIELRQRRREEAARGRDVRKQTDAWGRLLGARIRTQRVVRGATRISNAALDDAVNEDEGARKALDETLASLDELSAHLFALQHSLLQSYGDTKDASEGEANTASVLRLLEEPLKRCQESTASSKGKRRLNDEEHQEHISTLLALHQRIHSPMWRQVLGKWSWRTSSAAQALDDGRKGKNRFDGSAGENGIGGGLKAVNQSAEDQIMRGLQGEAFERLRKRTRVWRGTEKESRIVRRGREGALAGDDDDELEGAEAIANSTNDRHEDVDVFDDSDFYSTLLRELIDSKGAGSGGGVSGSGDGDGASSAWAQAAQRAAKKHRATIDRRASKGRRLRFDVHEKVQNFMPPIVRESWSEEQIERLIQQLRRTNNVPRQTADAEKQEGTEPTPVAAAVEMGGLRLFG